MGSTSSATSTSRIDLTAYALFSTPYSFIAFLLPFYIFELGGGPVEVGVAFSMYAWAVVVARPLAGWSADRLGRRATMIVGGTFLSASMALLGASTDVLHVYMAMFSSGIASSFVNVATIAYVSDAGGLESPELYSKMRVAAALGALGGGASIPIAYVLSRFGYALAFRALAHAFALVALAGLFLVPEETARLAARHQRGNTAAAARVVALAFLLGASTGLYGPQILPFLKERFSMSPFSAVLAYLPAVFSWFYGPRIAKPSWSRATAGFLIMAVALVAMYNSPSPIVFSASWVLESFGVALTSTSLDQTLSRHVKGVYWGRGYGIYQAANSLGYAIGAAASGLVPNPFYTALLPLASALTLSAVSRF